MKKISKSTKCKKERRNFRMGKAAIGTILLECIDAGRDGAVSAEAFMATMLSLRGYIEDADYLASEDIDAGLWMSFKARVDKSAERSAAARLRWDRIRAERATAAALAAPIVPETPVHAASTPVVVTATAVTPAYEAKPVEAPVIVPAETPQVAEIVPVPESELPEEMKELKRNSPLRPYKVTEEMRRYGIISVEEKGYIRFEKEGYTGKELKKRVEEYVHEILVRRRRRQGLPDRGW